MKHLYAWGVILTLGSALMNAVEETRNGITRTTAGTHTTFTHGNLSATRQPGNIYTAANTQRHPRYLYNILENRFNYEPSPSGQS